MRDLEQFEAAIDRVNGALRVVREKAQDESVRADFFNRISDEVLSIRSDLDSLRSDIAKLPRDIPSVDFSGIYDRISRVEDFVKQIKIPEFRDNSDKVIDHISRIKLPEVIEKTVLVEKPSVIETERVVEVSKDPVKAWSFKVIRDGGVITDIEAVARG